jgi:hypothetical protein
MSARLVEFGNKIAFHVMVFSGDKSPHMSMCFCKANCSNRLTRFSGRDDAGFAIAMLADDAWDLR